MLSEFEIIRRYFTRPTFHTVLGVGDDCALIRVAPGAELAVSTDMLVSGLPLPRRRRPGEAGPQGARGEPVGHGGDGREATVGNAFARFAHGGRDLAHRLFERVSPARGALRRRSRGWGHDARPARDLRADHGRGVGGTRIKARRRAAWRRGVGIGAPGGCGAAFGASRAGGRRSIPGRLRRACRACMSPSRGWPSAGRSSALPAACVDISDGLAADLGHILERSKVAAVDRAVTGAALDACLTGICQHRGSPALLSGGDDYELCFTAPVERHRDVLRASDAARSRSHASGGLFRGPA